MQDKFYKYQFFPILKQMTLNPIYKVNKNMYILQKVYSPISIHGLKLTMSSMIMTQVITKKISFNFSKTTFFPLKKV